MRFLLNVMQAVFCIGLFAIVQFSSAAVVGFLDWFFENLPSSKSVWDYPLLYISSTMPADYIIMSLPITALACSLLFFMKRKRQWAYFTIISPLFVCMFLMIMFTFAAQMHVPPGQGLYSSGVLLGKVESAALKEGAQAGESDGD